MNICFEFSWIYPEELICWVIWSTLGFSVVKNLPANAGDSRDVGLIPRVRKIPWRRKWQPAPLFLPGESHGQWSLVGYSPWGHRESNVTEQPITHTHTHTHTHAYTHAHAHTCRHTHMHAHMHTHAHIDMHTHRQTHTRTHTVNCA